MQLVFFYHSLISDWNHGDAYFLRGVVKELQQQSDDLVIGMRRDNNLHVYRRTTFPQNSANSSICCGGLV